MICFQRDTQEAQSNFDKDLGKQSMKDSKDYSYILYVLIGICLVSICISIVTSTKSHGKNSSTICPQCRGYGVDITPYFWLISPAPIKLKNGKYVCINPIKDQYQFLFEQYISNITQYKYCINCMGDGIIFHN